MVSKEIWAEYRVTNCPSCPVEGEYGTFSAKTGKFQSDQDVWSAWYVQRNMNKYIKYPFLFK